MKLFSTHLVGENIDKLVPNKILHSKLLRRTHSLEIAAAYYSLDFLELLLERFKNYCPGGATISFYFNREYGPRLQSQLEALMQLKLKYSTYSKTIDFYFVNLGKLFHSKLYKLSTIYDEYIYYIGSSNCSTQGFSQNEEILLQFRRKNKILSFEEYFEELYQNSESLESIKTESIVPDCLTNFFYNGILYSKINHPVNFSFQLRLPERLSNLIRQESEIIPGLGGTSGKTYNLLQSINNHVSADASKTSFKHLCIETCYGMWVPFDLVNEVAQKISDASRTKKSNFERMKSYFFEPKKIQYLMSLAIRTFQQIDNLAATNSIILEESPCHRLIRLARYIVERQKYFENPKWSERYSKLWIKSSVPNFDFDKESYESFSDSFFEYLSYLSSTSSNKQIYQKLKTLIGFDDGLNSDELREEFVNHYQSI